MTTITVIDTPYASLYYHTNTGIVHHKFHKALDSKHFRQVLDGGIELLQTHGATKWLSDNRDMDPHNEEDGQWTNESWLPRAIAAGWKYWALVVPDDVAARINMAEFVNSFYERGLRIMVFTDIESAEKWLIEVNAQETYPAR